MGEFRGGPGVEGVEVRVGSCWGVPSPRVASDVDRFLRDLLSVLDDLDDAIPPGRVPQSADELEAVLVTAALAHAKLVEIHPFANGTGRTARILANWVLMRYGIPPFVRLRPRPEGDRYAEAARDALCAGDYDATIAWFMEVFDVSVGGQSPEP